MQKIFEKRYLNENNVISKYKILFQSIMFSISHLNLYPVQFGFTQLNAKASISKLNLKITNLFVLLILNIIY